MEHTYFNFSVQSNAIKADGEDTVIFTRPVVITDDSMQYNETRYDIPSMEVEWDGKLNADHSHKLEGIIGRVMGLKKGRKKVTIDGIKFAIKENALAKFARDMLLGGFATDFSIETVGPWPDEEGVYYNSKLVGCAMVVDGNNKSASLSQLAFNSIQESKKLGLDTQMIEDVYLNQPFNNFTTPMTFVTIKNSRGFAVKVSYKNASGEEVTKTLLTNESVDVSEDQKESVEKQINEAAEPTPPAPAPAASPSPAPNEEMIKNLLSPLTEKITQLEQKMFDNAVKEPVFRSGSAPTGSGALAQMNWKDRTSKQINAAWEMIKQHSSEGSNVLRDINKFHLEQLQKTGKVSNTLTLSDFGNFVIADELLSEIQGFRSNYGLIVSRFPFQETLSLTMAWLNRVGDISMTEVDMCDDGDTGNLKPVKEYTATIKETKLHELAAVTPVCNAATRFLAADLLGDVAQGYRTEYERKLAQLVIARLEQAVEANGNSITYTTTTDLNALKSWISVLSELAEETPNGVLIMNYKSYWQLVTRMVGSGISGDIKQVFTMGDVNPVLGINTIVVPNDLLPTLNTAETKSFVVGGTTVTVNHAVFYVDPANFKGRTSGGLMYDLSTEAAYEEGGAVKSAFQRNELVLRGAFFRGGEVLNNELVSALKSAGVS